MLFSSVVTRDYMQHFSVKQETMAVITSFDWVINPGADVSRDEGGVLSTGSHRPRALCSTHSTEIYSSVFSFNRGHQQVTLTLRISCYVKTFSINSLLFEGKETNELKTIFIRLLVPIDFVVGFVMVTAGDV